MMRCKLLKSLTDQIPSDKVKLSGSFSGQGAKGHYGILIDAGNGRWRRRAAIEIRFEQVGVLARYRASSWLAFAYPYTSKPVGNW